jgi:hypothetical protein
MRNLFDNKEWIKRKETAWLLCIYDTDNFGRNKRTMKNKRKKYQKEKEKGGEREKVKRKLRLWDC